MKYVVGATSVDEVTQREIENKNVAYNAALEGIVLLKNENNALPLEKGKIALYGTGAILTVKGGTGSGEVNERHSTTILEGMLDAGFEVTTMSWLKDVENDYLEAKRAYAEKFKKLKLVEMINSMNVLESVTLPYGRKITEDDIAASNCDCAIYVVARQAGEGQDKKIEKGEFDLSPMEIENIKILSSNYKKVILVINSGSYMNISDLDNVKIDAILFFAQQGCEGGKAFASLISGKVSPSGKLADTWVKKYSDIPCCDDYSYRSGDTSQEYYKEGIYVGYRYFDTFKIEPRYHFGYGLSYSSFFYKTLNVNLDKDTLTLDVEVTNIGKYDGKEVMQVYASCPKGTIKKEYQRLVGFAKTKTLKPNESQVLTISFNMDYLVSYNEKNASNVLEKGTYVIRLGNASNNTKVVANIIVDETIVVRKLKNISPLSKQFDEIEPQEREIDNDITIPSFTYKKEGRMEEVCYYEPGVYHSKEIDDIIHSLKEKELLDIVVGTGFHGLFNTKNIVCPGAVGMTTDKFIKKGLVNVNLADGPAGLRLLKRSAISNRGILKLRMVDYMMEFMEYFPNYLKKFINPHKNDKIIYQFTTAFPVGTSLAQSWNQELVEEVGKAVSKEMNEYNVTYWLAPAMNIHRNPLCGRNFEYYSEDPVLTGKIASSITRGVQATSGCYVTIKHFACNNQEDNRNKCNSNVHERALREIYLRGFEIAVREAYPKSVMTSYNLVNGVYTANSHDLINKVLRNEWGFNGVVMTDWYATGKEAGTNIQLGRDEVAINVGNDLIMPGTAVNRKVLKQALKDGSLSKEALNRAAANIIKQILESNVNKKYPPETFLKK